MRKRFSALGVALTAVLTLASCLNSSDSEVTVYNDMAITSFTLGTLNRYLHTTSSEGGDSVYKTTFTGGNYIVAIDQVGRRIFNQDSLPLGTDLKHVLCTIGTKNSGYVFLKSLISDSLFYHDSSDSIDFSKQRELHVYASDGSGHRVYTVNLTARQAKGTPAWRETAAADFPQHIDSLLYRLSGDGRIERSTDCGQTWTDEPLGDDVELLPTGEAAFVSWPLSSHSAYSLMVGRGSEDNVSMTVWRKITHEGMAAQWVYMPLADDNPYYLPLMERVVLVWYDNSVLAFGSNGVVYQCKDQGISWKPVTGYTLPDDVNVLTLETVVDGDGILWLRDTSNGKTYALR